MSRRSALWGEAVRKRFLSPISRLWKGVGFRDRVVSFDAVDDRLLGSEVSVVAA